MTEFEASLYNFLMMLPKGKLTTYGQLAAYCGYPGRARHVGKTLSQLPKDSKVPWYRVVNSQGKISLTGEAFIRQKKLLQEENIEVNDNGRILKFKQYLY